MNSDYKCPCDAKEGTEELWEIVGNLPLERLREIIDANNDGRLVLLPPDGQIYHIEESIETEECWIGNKPCQYIMGEGYYCGWGLVTICFPFSEIGKTVFLSRIEAESALEKRRKSK